MANTRIERARAEIGASHLPGSGGRYIYRAEEPGEWYVVSADEMASLCDYLDHEDEDIRADAYSHWCGATSPVEITRAQVQALGAEAGEAGDLAMAALCDRALEQDGGAVDAVALAILAAMAAP